MQFFNRVLTYKGLQKDPCFVDQTPCLIVRKVINKKPYDNDEELSAYFEDLQEQNFYCKDKVVLTYADYIEPIAPAWVIFDRNMALLLPNEGKVQQTGNRFENSEAVFRWLQASQSHNSFILN